MGLCVHHFSKDTELFHDHTIPSCPFITRATSLHQNSPSPWQPLICSLFLKLGNFKMLYKWNQATCNHLESLLFLSERA